jgi:hypothetical protein
MSSSTDYSMPAPPGARKLSLRVASAELAARHLALSDMFGCTGHGWSDCEMFALARMRGICHTLYVVIGDEQIASYAVFDWCDEGPSGALYALAADGFDSYASALRFASKQIADEDDTEHDRPVLP